MTWPEAIFGAVALITAAWAYVRRSMVDEPDDRDDVMDLWYCESVRLRLHPGQLYRFKVDPTCDSCRKMKAAYDEAWKQD